MLGVAAAHVLANVGVDYFAHCMPCPTVVDGFAFALPAEVYLDVRNTCLPCPPEDNSFVVVDSQNSTNLANVNRDVEHFAKRDSNEFCLRTRSHLQMKTAHRPVIGT